MKIPRDGEDVQDSMTKGSANGFYNRKANTNPNTSSIVTEIPVKVRDDRWDFIRLVLIWALIGSHLVSSFHFEAGLQFSRNSFPGLAAYAFGGLVFLSGMFSASLQAKSVMMTLVGLPATLFLLAALTWAASVLTPGRKDTFEIGRSMAECYLECMFLWRLTVSPLFYCFARCKAPKILPLALVCVTSWILAYPKFHMPDTLELHIAALPKICLPWHLLISNAPFFAAGVLVTPKRWSELMDKRALTLAAYVLLSIFFLSSLWPSSYKVLSLRKIQPFDTLEMFCVVFASTFVIGSWLAPLQAMTPTLAQHLTCCSRRCCQAFNFHWVLFVLAGGRLGFPFFARKLVHMNARSEAAIVCLTSLWLTLVLSSRFAELACGWLLNLPVNLVDFLSKYIEINSNASEKAFEAFEPVYFRKFDYAQKTPAFSMRPSELILSGA
jgi:hypothetical protein